MPGDLRAHIYQNMDMRSTGELVQIWQENDRSIWSDTAFEVINAILAQRLEEVPPQGEPIYQHEEQPQKRALFDDIKLSPFTDPENAPELYNPREVLWLQKQIDRLAVIYVGVTVLVNLSRTGDTFAITANYLINNQYRDVIAILITVVISLLLSTLQCAIGYFAIRALGSILKILMEMEFNSRAKENPE